MHGDTERFDQSAVSQGDMWWQLETAFCGDAIIAGECSVVWGRCGEAHGLAEVIAATAAMGAGVAGDSWF
jgi:hypothetical protein